MPESLQDWEVADEWDAADSDWEPADSPESRFKPLSDQEFGSMLGVLRPPAAASPSQPESPFVKPGRYATVNPGVVGVGGADIPQPYGEAAEILSSPSALLNAPLSYLGKPLNAAASDVGALLGTTAAGEPSKSGTQGGNLYDLFTREEPIYSSKRLPQQKVLADISKSNPAVATVGKVAGSLIESAPLIAIMPQAALGKLVAAGFTADMLSHAGDAATSLGEEMGKPPDQRDHDKITTALSTIASSAAFAPLTGAHAGGKVIGERVAPRAEAIRELANQLKQEPARAPTGEPVAQRRLGIRVPEGEFAQPGVPELAGQALKEAQSPIEVPGRTPAIELLRNQIQPPQIEAAPSRLAERIEGGGEAPYGKVSYQREFSAPVKERIQNAVQRKTETPVRDVQQPEVTQKVAGEVPATERVAEAGNGGGALSSEKIIEMTPDEFSKWKSEVKYGEETAQKIADSLTPEQAARVSGEAKKLADQTKQVAAKYEGKPIDEAALNELQENFKVSAKAQTLREITENYERSKSASKGLTGPEVADLVGAEFRGTTGKNGELMQFEAKKPDGTPSTSFSVRVGSTPEQVLAKYQEVVDRYKDDPTNAPRPAKSSSPKPSEAVAPEPLLESPAQSVIESAISSIEKLQQQLRGGSKSGQTMMGVPHAILDTALEAARLSLKAGKSVAEAIEAALLHIRKNVKAFDENKVREMFERELQNRVGSISAESVKPTTGIKVQADSGEGRKNWESKLDYRDVTGKPTDVSASQRKYAQSLSSQKSDNILALSNHLQWQFEQAMKALGMKPSEFGRSQSWSLWDIGKQIYLKDHPSESTGYRLADPFTDSQLQREMVHRMVGWEIERAKGAQNFPPSKILSRIGENALANRPYEYVPVSLKSAVHGQSGGTPIEAGTRGGATLDDIYKIFEPAPKSGTSLKQKGINLIEGFRTGFSSKFRPLNKLAEDVAKAYGITGRKDIAALAEQLKGSQGKAEAEIYRFDKDVSDLVKGNEKDFNVYMFIRRSLDRLNQDSKDIGRALAGEDVPTLNRRRVAEHTINGLTKQLQELESHLGPEKTAKFEQAADSYQKYMDDSLQLQVRSGRMSPEVYDTIKNGNQFYAPFKVAKYFEQQMKPSGVGKSIDTQAEYTQAMKGIEDADFKLGDMQAAARQNILVSRILADKNNVMRKFSELAAQDVNKQYIRRLGRDEAPATGKEFITVREAGKPVRYEVDPQIASTIKSLDSTSQGVVLDYLGKGAIPFRAGATTLNVPFQAVNLIAADLPRQALVSKYGIKGVDDLIRYPMGFIESAFSAIAGNNFGFKNKLYRDYLESGTAGNTLQESLTPEALKFKEPTSISKSAKLGRTVIYSLADFAKAIEETNKIHGVKRAMREEGVKSGKELSPEAVTEIRRFSGSPDFGRVGGITEQAGLNVFQPFFNARLQGAIADVGRLAGRDGAKTAAATWGKLGAAVGSAALYAYMLNNREENREDYAKRPTQEKQNYFLIPKSDADGQPRYVTMEDGSKVRDYWRIPKRETVKWFANSLESALDFARDKDPKALSDFGANMLQEVTPVNIQGNNVPERLESVVSGLNPLIKGPIEVATGRDTYRHRDLIPDTMKNASPEKQYKETTPEFFKGIAAKVPGFAPEFLRSPLMLENITRNLTAGLITQFLPRKQLQGRSGAENNPLTQRFQSLPYTDNAEFQSDMDSLKREAADVYLDRHRKALELVKQVTPRDGLDAVKFPEPIDPKLVRHVVDLYAAKEAGANPEDFQILALPAQQRADYIIRQLNRQKTDAAKEQLMEIYARKRIVTKAVLEAMAAQQPE